MNFVIEKELTDCSNLSVSVMEKEEAKEAEGKGQQQEQQEGFVLCFC